MDPGHCEHLASRCETSTNLAQKAVRQLQPQREANIDEVDEVRVKEQKLYCKQADPERESYYANHKAARQTGKGTGLAAVKHTVLKPWNALPISRSAETHQNQTIGIQRAGGPLPDSRFEFHEAHTAPLHDCHNISGGRTPDLDGAGHEACHGVPAQHSARLAGFGVEVLQPLARLSG